MGKQRHAILNYRSRCFTNSSSPLKTQMFFNDTNNIIVEIQTTECYQNVEYRLLEPIQ